MKKLFVILILLVSTPLWAATYYVSQSGTGDGSAVGTPDSVEDFNAGVFGELDGDTVYFCGTINTALLPPDSGTDGSVATLSGDCSSQGGTDATIDRNSYGSDGAYGIRLDAKDYVVITDFTIIDGGTGIEIKGDCDYVTIKKCTIYDQSLHGVFVYEDGANVSDNVVIGGASGDGNTMYDIGDDTAGADITVANDHTNGEISYNTLHDSNGDDNTRGIGGIWMVAVDPGDGNEWYIQYNEIGGHDDQEGSDKCESAMSLKYSSNIIVRYNYIHSGQGSSTLQSGIRISGGPEADIASDIEIYGNWIDDYNVGIHPNDQYALGACGVGYELNTVYIHHNLITNCANGGINVGTNGDCTGGADPLPIELVYIYNNTLYRCAHTPDNSYEMAIYLADTAARNRNRVVEVKNNLIINSRDGETLKHAIGVNDTDQTYLDLNYNTFYHSGESATTDIYRWGFSATYYNLSEVQSALGTLEDNSDWRDPKLSDVANDDFTLLSDSSEIDDGIDLGTYSGLDPNNTDWTTTPPTVEVLNRDTAGWDRGAYIYVPASEPANRGVSINGG